MSLNFSFLICTVALRTPNLWIAVGIPAVGIIHFDDGTREQIE
jgi:hypothetical protein